MSFTHLLAYASTNSDVQTLLNIQGVGVTIATAFVARVPNIHMFKRGRSFSSWLGITCRAYSSGQTRRLNRIIKQGDRYLRSMLIHGARAALMAARRNAAKAGYTNAADSVRPIQPRRSQEKNNDLISFDGAVHTRHFRTFSTAHHLGQANAARRRSICSAVNPFLLKSHWLMVVMDQYTRRIIGFGVHAGSVDGPALCRMFNEATSGQGWPKYPSSDNDPLFQYHRWKANLRVLDIDEIRSLPHVPMSHPFVERLFGSVRREMLDQTFFWTSTDLEKKLGEHQRYYNESRTHSSRQGSTPIEASGSKVVDINNYRWKKHYRGLFQLPIAS